MSCDAPPGDDADSLMPRRPRYDKSQTCVKCKAARGNLVIKHAVYCSACLPPMLTRKFRRALSASLPLRPDASPSPPVLLALSGGPSSTVLLDIVHSLFSLSSTSSEARPYAKRRDLGTIRAVHVDWSGVGGEGCVEGLRRVVEGYGVELIVIKGESAFDEGWWEGVGGGEKGDVRIDLSNERLPFLPHPPTLLPPLASLQTHLSRLPTPSSLPPTLTHLTRLLLTHLAHSLSTPLLLLGTSLPRLSISLLDSISNGAGFAIGAEREEDVLLPNAGEVKIIRPLREWSAKEIGWWVHSRRLTIPRSLGSKSALLAPYAGKGIGKLTEDFVMGLERDYPSTVSTISRTCAKVVPSSEPDHICVFCRRPAQRNASLWKSNTAILTLPALSSLTLNPSPAPSSPPSPPPTPPSPTPPDTLAPHLCYACHTNLTSRGGVGAGKRAVPVIGQGGEEGTGEGMPMPVWVTRPRPMGREEMRGAVEGFLLDEED